VVFPPAYSYAGDRENRADYLIDDGANDDAYTVEDAWFYGIDINQPAGVTLKVSGETSTCGNDKIWGQSTVISDPAVDDQFTIWTHSC
jgi:hypothetical protein